VDTQVATALITAGAGVATGVITSWINTQQIGKRMDSLERRMDRLEDKIEKLAEEFRAFKDIVNSKFRDLDTEIAKLLDRKS
jgi:archaellum component FlaC